MSIIKEIWTNHIRYRTQIIKLAKADLKKESTNSFLGNAWHIIKPVIMIASYWFAISIGLRADKSISEFPYILWLLAGIIPWFYISDILSAGANSLRKNSYLITKMKFPVDVIPTFTNVSKLFVHIILIIITIIIFMVMGHMPTIHYLQLPLYILLTFIFLNLWSFFTSVLVVFSKDVYQFIKSIITPLFWLSGVIWNVDKIDIDWLKLILNLNPITYLVTGYRNCLLNGKWFWELGLHNVAFFVALLILGFLGFITYKKMRKDIPDVL